MRRTVLVVDDNEKIVEVLAAYLEAAGYEVVTAHDGEAAIEAVRARRPDIALLDIMLPGVDGIELTRRFQRDYDLPVILVTAKTEEIDRLIGLEVGADDYVSKPFSPREVVARVKAVLRRVDRSSATSAGETIVVGDLVVDTARREVTVAGEKVELTRTEFEILATMAAHPGRVYSRLQLLEAVSGDAFEGYERTIDAHVKNIRKKIGDDPKEPRYIRTVFGVGYKVEAPS
ncbi:MAG: response regulator transcription factor [Anaerosomatales bacterium]|nr:response regulator transcription factor [Anaerosomatales bacterium]GAV31082.1 response regulators consisting of a CheY-like receiver domain and a winged-helix DNA-binding domain [Coriobacteriaceae bacterium EMTCatB1]